MLDLCVLQIASTNVRSYSQIFSQVDMILTFWKNQNLIQISISRVFFTHEKLHARCIIEFTRSFLARAIKTRKDNYICNCKCYNKYC